MVSNLAKRNERLTVPAWTKIIKRRVSDLSIKEVRALINGGYIPTEMDKKKNTMIAFTTDTNAMKQLSAARKKSKSKLGKPIGKRDPVIRTNSPLPNNMLVEGQPVWVGKSFCPAVGMGVTTMNGYIKDGVFDDVNIRIEKVGNGVERAKYKIDWPGLVKGMQIKKICYSHKSIAEKRDLMEALFAPDIHGLEDEPDDSKEVQALEEKIGVSEDTANPSISEIVCTPVLSSKEKIKEAFLELVVALAEPVVLRLKKKGVIK